ncbi:type II toxin-antitoxin system RnlB family antitoxin [Sporanaerobacter sp. PP17-6a]|uniref:type II toxin-antitoxin system RnlB family antitoxin n=1 Tax=Sporanaerobacter sp. PP17-6a TaxID=1891289 RepID=UPI00089F98B9|nr:type II toxin-antitoxin system RnlB family antitoxin [Sporanaerobacter sp. PP17-6a]SCL88148.1 Antitoxin LsoB [Sporanaerobacter sp. PP17-6a]
MSKYKIEYIRSGAFSALIISLTYENIFKELEKIEKELTDNHINGMVVFDNLLKTGNNEERFISAFFNGTKFDRNSFKFTKISRVNSVRQLSCSSLRNYKENIEMSILNKFQKDLLLRGLNI